MCLKDIKKKSNYSHLKSKSHKEFEKYKHLIISVKNVDIKDVDNRAFKSWSNCLRDAISNLKEEGYHFNHIAEMDIITLVHKRGMTYDFYLKHYMSAIEWKLNAKINKDKNLINNFPRNWRHPNNSI